MTSLIYTTELQSPAINGGSLDTRANPSQGEELPILGAAIDYCGRGFSVIAVVPRGKRPTMVRKGYQQDPAPSESDLLAMWSTQPDLNVGIVTGHGIVVIDIDIDIDIDKHDGKMSGQEALTQLEGIYGPTLKAS